MEKANSTAIILAAGQGKRMGSDVPKQYLEIQGKPIIFYTLQTFQESEFIDEIILVVGESEVEIVREQIVNKFEFSKVSHIIEGGKERYDSVWEGLKVLSEQTKYAFIHDGVRMLVSEDILLRTAEGVREYGACIAAMPVKDTIKIGDENGFVQQTLERDQVWQIQTPQAFEVSIIKEAHQKLREQEIEGVTDDSMVVEKVLNIPIKMVEGSYKNIKITTPEDLKLAMVFLAE
ncbi:2-C-methyl-D-erythritol 4-phosphate cytidylyltransferase [Lachnospiraceae bacterium OttesenSCG-928-E19]|nr:2-C-methyl-D-erythritol 4-phosphate cytidylyltransferase [Lachnospiraceae bacterium OttesenSCG-928-E19]